MPESELERRVAKLIKTGKLPPFVRQFRVYDDFGFVARIDIAYPKKLVGIEAHSRKWHSSPAAQGRDAERHARLKALGWRIIYVTSEDLDERPKETLAKIRAALDRQLFGTGTTT